MTSNIPNISLKDLVIKTRDLDNHVYDVIEQVNNGREIQLPVLLHILENVAGSARSCSQFLLIQQEEHKKLRKEMNEMRQEVYDMINEYTQLASNGQGQVASKSAAFNKFKQFNLKL